MSPTIYKAIVAMASNRVIGREGGLPWHLPADLKWFKKLTTGHPVVMGRKTMTSLSGPLPRRRNLVVSRSLFNGPAGFEMAGSWEQAKQILQGEPVVFVIGGAGLFESAIGDCAELYLSRLQRSYEGDVYLPEIEKDFLLQEVLHQDDDFELQHWHRSSVWG